MAGVHGGAKSKNSWLKNEKREEEETGVSLQGNTSKLVRPSTRPHLFKVLQPSNSTK
jgi:hypothetical protein